MTRPTVMEGVLVALLGSVVMGPLALSLGLLLGPALAAQASVAVLVYAYILYTLARSGRTTGRVTLALLSAMLLLGSVAWATRWSTVVLLAVALLWAVRACVASRSLVAAGLHGLLCLLGLAAGLWTSRHSSNSALAVWSFLLIQALGGLIPPCLPRSTARPHGVHREADPFVAAHQAAQQALRHLEAHAR